MEGFHTVRTWFNQRIVNFLRDFKNEREAEEDPSPTCAVCRIAFVVLLMVGFLLLLVYHFIGSPDVWVEQINVSKDKDYARCSLHAKDNCKMNSPSIHTTQRNPVVWPCSKTSVKWRDFVSFNIIRENSTEWNVTFGKVDSNNSKPSISVPDRTEANENLLKNHIVDSGTNITIDEFCNFAVFWPTKMLANEKEKTYGAFVCQYMASTLLLAGNDHDNYHDGYHISQNRPTESLESPYLLNREVFKNRVAERARESVLRGRLDLDIDNFDNRIVWKAYNFYADNLTRVLDKFETAEWCSYYQGAIDLQHHLNFIINMGDQNPWIIYLSNDNGLHFLHPKVDWMTYYEDCAPLYCEETKKMSRARQAYRAFGLLGGVTTLVLGLVTVLLWPAFGFVLSWCCRKPIASAAGGPEHPEVPFASSTGGDLPPALAPQEPDSTSVVPRSVASLELHRRVSQRHTQP